MAETNAPPTDAEIKAIRNDIDSTDFIVAPKTLQSYALSALAQFKLDLEDKRGIKFTQVFDTTNDKYFEDTDGNTRNDDKIAGELLPNLAISKVFRDFAISTSDNERWWALANEYEARYDDRLKIAKFDVDLDEDGSIDEDEERTSSQTFFRK